ncbi:hypothetical protein SETIT_5G211700v2 [Setaria italica]|uniref:Leucine-rich repeat-containing N-terminal plant-type domain-containing protein n=1 Tax=Setaria italica TaxID=4555 RepID=A0A368R748_SETIT|nr:hypothetical protein SETIT_5G211700v2 [Setaria italica]
MTPPPKTLPLLLLFLLIAPHLLASASAAFVSRGLSASDAARIRRRQLLQYSSGGDHGHDDVAAVDPSYSFPNPRLRDAYVALQAWRRAILSDPRNVTGTWHGPDVCAYAGIFCAPSPTDPHLTVVASVDLNHADLAGHLPEELGLLTDLAVLHLNSNRFCGLLCALHELDLSNNRLVGPFPDVVLRMPGLRYLDLRYNDFEGPSSSTASSTPSSSTPTDSASGIPDNVGNSPASVLVLANNDFGGCLPASVANMSGTLDQIILMNTGLKSCIPPEIGALKGLTVLDLSFNKLMGAIPGELAGLRSVEQLDLGHNRLVGDVPEGICHLPRLQNFTYSYNFITGEPRVCLLVDHVFDRRNCVPDRPDQRSPEHCSFFENHHSTTPHRRHPTTRCHRRTGTSRHRRLQPTPRSHRRHTTRYHRRTATSRHHLQPTTSRHHRHLQSTTIRHRRPTTRCRRRTGTSRRRRHRPASPSTTTRRRHRLPPRRTRRCRPRSGTRHPRRHHGSCPSCRCTTTRPRPRRRPGGRREKLDSFREFFFPYLVIGHTVHC